MSLAKTTCEASSAFRLHFVFEKLRQAADVGVTAAALASEFGVCTKTIYRDVETLRTMGVQIKSQNEGWPVNGYTIVSGNCPFCKSPLEKN